MPIEEIQPGVKCTGGIAQPEMLGHQPERVGDLGQPKRTSQTSTSGQKGSSQFRNSFILSWPKTTKKTKSSQAPILWRNKHQKCSIKGKSTISIITSQKIACKRQRGCSGDIFLCFDYQWLFHYKLPFWPLLALIPLLYLI